MIRKKIRKTIIFSHEKEKASAVSGLSSGIYLYANIMLKSRVEPNKKTSLKNKFAFRIILSDYDGSLLLFVVLIMITEYAFFTESI